MKIQCGLLVIIYWLLALVSGEKEACIIVTKDKEQMANDKEQTTNNKQQITKDNRLIYWVNQVLLLDVFFVLLSFFWFAIALLGRSIGVPLGFDIWYSLWQPLFLPAISILMAGTIISGLISQISKRLKSN